MIEFGLLIGAGVLALALATALGRSILGRAVKLRLITSAHSTAFGGLRNYLSVHDRALLAFTGLIAVATFVGVGVVRTHMPHDAAASSYGLAGWITVALLLGAASTAFATHLASHAMARTSPRIDDAVKHGAADALREGIHGAGASTLALCTVLLLGLTTLAITAFGSAGGFDNNVGIQPAQRMALLITPYALGATIATIVTHTIGGLFVASSISDVSRSVGIHLDVPVSRVPDLFATMATAVVATTVVCVGAAPGSAGSPTAMALCPLIVLAFGILSSAVGVAVVRTDTSEPIGAAIDRGLGVTMTLGAASFVGITQWLFGTSWWRMLLAAAAGLLGAIIVLVIERSFAARRARALTGDALDSVVIGRWGSSFQRATLLSSVALATAIGGFVAGKSTGLDHGGTLGLALATLGMLAPAPFVLTTATFHAIVVRRLNSNLAGSTDTTIAERRFESAAAGLSSARAYAAVSTAMVAWTVVPAFARLTGLDATRITAETRWEVLAAAGLVGALLVLAVAGADLRAVASVVRAERAHSEAIDSEEQGVSSPGRTQRASATLHEAVRHGIPVVLLTLGIPAILWALLRLSSAAGASVAATGSLVLGASFAGLAVSLSVDAIGDSWNIGSRGPSSDTHRDKSVDVSKKWAKNPRDGVAVVGDTLGSPLQSLVVPCIHALVKLLATAALALAPLFF